MTGETLVSSISLRFVVFLVLRMQTLVTFKRKSYAPSMRRACSMDLIWIISRPNRKRNLLIELQKPTGGGNDSEIGPEIASGDQEGAHLHDPRRLVQRSNRTEINLK